MFLCDVVRGRRRLFHRRRYHHRQRPRLHARFLLDIRSVLILFVVVVVVVVVEDFPSFLLVLFALQTRRFLSSYVSFLPRRRRCGRNHRRRRRRGRKRDVDGCTVLDSTRHQSAASKRNGALYSSSSSSSDVVRRRCIFWSFGVESQILKVIVKTYNSLFSSIPRSTFLAKVPSSSSSSPSSSSSTSTSTLSGCVVFFRVFTFFSSFSRIRVVFDVAVLRDW